MEKSMMLYTTATNGAKTFGLIPLNGDCPFNEAIYMPNLEALDVLGNKNRDTFTMLERLDENGNPSGQSGKGGDPAKPKMHRVQISSPWEYFIHEREEIKDFVKRMAVNADSFDYQQFIKTESGIEIVRDIVQ